MCVTHHASIGQYCSDNGEVLRLVHISPITWQYSLLIIQIILAWTLDPTVRNQRVKQKMKMIFLLHYLWEEWMLGKTSKYLMLHFPLNALLTHLLALPLQPPQVLFPSALASSLGCPVHQSAPKCKMIFLFSNPNFVRWLSQVF